MLKHAINLDDKRKIVRGFIKRKQTVAEISRELVIRPDVITKYLVGAGMLQPPKKKRGRKPKAVNNGEINSLDIKSGAGVVSG